MISYIYIPFWKNSKDLNKCLKAIKTNTKYISYKLNIIHDKKGQGFTQNINSALKNFLKNANQLDSFILLNSDTEPKKDWLKELVKAKNKHKNTGIFSSLTTKNNKIFWGGTRHPLNKKKGLIPLDTLVKTGRISNFKGDQVNPWAEFAAVLITYDCLKKTGSFNNKLNHYGSDVEFCYRAKKKGFKTRYISKSIVKHKKQASLKQFTPKQRLNLFKDLKLLKKLIS